MTARPWPLRRAVDAVRASVPDATPIGSGNAKTQSIGTYAPRSTCPTSCPLVGICYGEAIDRYAGASGPFSREGDVTATWAAAVRTFGRTGKPVRLGVTGDWVGPDGRVDHERVHAVYDAAVAVGGSESQLVAWGYTHVPVGPDAHWLALLRSAGVVISRSDVLAPDGAIVVAPGDPIPDGAVECPVQTGRVASCADCLLCGRRRRKAVAFRAHGANHRAIVAALRAAYGGNTWTSRR